MQPLLGGLLHGIKCECVQCLQRGDSPDQCRLIELHGMSCHHLLRRGRCELHELQCVYLPGHIRRFKLQFMRLRYLFCRSGQRLRKLCGGKIFNLWVFGLLTLWTRDIFACGLICMFFMYRGYIPRNSRKRELCELRRGKVFFSRRFSMHGLRGGYVLARSLDGLHRLP